MARKLRAALGLAFMRFVGIGVKSRDVVYDVVV
jgi:hypothetical protein